MTSFVLSPSSLVRKEAIVPQEKSIDSASKGRWNFSIRLRVVSVRFCIYPSALLKKSFMLSPSFGRIYERSIVKIRRIQRILREIEIIRLVFDQILPLRRVNRLNTLFSKKVTGILRIIAIKSPMKIGDKTFSIRDMLLVVGIQRKLLKQV